MITQNNLELTHSAPVRKNKEMQEEAQVDNSMQVTVVCPPKPRVDAFVHRNAGKVYCAKQIPITI